MAPSERFISIREATASFSSPLHASASSSAPLAASGMSQTPGTDKNAVRSEGAGSPIPFDNA